MVESSIKLEAESNIVRVAALDPDSNPQLALSIKAAREAVKRIEKSEGSGFSPEGAYYLTNVGH